MAITRKKFTVWMSIRGGLVAGAAAAIINNIYNYAYGVFFHFTIEEYINFPIITFLSILAAIIAALGYYVLVKATRKYGFYFKIICIIVLLISFLWSISPTLPDGTHTPSGFKMLSMPLHIITTACIMYIIPASTDVRRY
jgi:hypothetical protein